VFWGLFCHFLAIISRSLTGLRFISLVLFMNFCLKLSWVSLFSTLFNLSFCIYTDMSCYSSSLCYKFVVSLWNDYIRIRITKKNKTFRILLFFFVTVAEMCFFCNFHPWSFFFQFCFDSNPSFMSFFTSWSKTSFSSHFVPWAKREEGEESGQITVKKRISLKTDAFGWWNTLFLMSMSFIWREYHLGLPFHLSFPKN